MHFMGKQLVQIANEQNCVIWVIFKIEGVIALPMLSSAESGNQAVIYMREKAKGASE